MVNYVHVPVGGLSGTRTYTVDAGSGADGDFMHFSNHSGNVLNIVIPGGATKPIGNTQPQDWVEAQRIGANWYFISTGGVV